MKIVGPQLRHTVYPRVGFVVFFLVWHPSLAAQSSSSPVGQPELNDAHFHLTNYIQEGPDIQTFLRIMGTRVGRVALFATAYITLSNSDHARFDPIITGFNPADMYAARSHPSRSVDIPWCVLRNWGVHNSQRVSLRKSDQRDRFLFGTDEVTPTAQERYLKIYEQYRALWALLIPEASERVRKVNYERIFDTTRQNVCAWEAAHHNELTEGREAP